MEIVGYKNNASKAVLIVHLEEIIEGDNPELAKILFTNGTLEGWNVLQNKTLTYSSFNPTKFVRSDQYTSYIGTSTNEKCERSLILHSQHSEFISTEQMKNFGGSKMKPFFKPKVLFNNITVMQNFAPLSLDLWDPLTIVHRDSDMLPPAFPVAIQYGSIMYNPLDVINLGAVPTNGVPFWKKTPKEAKVVRTQTLPKAPLGFKLMVFYFWKDLSSGWYYPKYIVVPKSYRPNKGAQPNKIPIAIRSKFSYPNHSKQVVLLDMVVTYIPPQKKKVSLKERIKKLRAAFNMAKLKGGLAWQAGSTVQPASSTPKANTTNDEASAEFDVTRMCTKIKLEVILNVRRQSWVDVKDLPESLRALIHECDQYEYQTAGLKTEPSKNETSISTNKTENKIENKPTTSEKVKMNNIVHDVSKENFAMIKKLCQKHELHVVLNREGAGSEINDYVKHFCKDQVIHNKEHKQLVMLAKLKKELSGYLAQKGLANNNLHDSDQFSLSSSSGPIGLTHLKEIY